MDEISQEPRWDFRLPPRRRLAVLAAVVLIAAAAVLAGTRGGGRPAVAGRHPSVPANRPAVLATPSPPPPGVPGTVLLACDSTAGSQQGTAWHRGSLRAGPLWFVDGRRLGYVQAGLPDVRRGRGQPGKPQLIVMIVEVAPGSPVVLRAAAGTQTYFRFVYGFGPGVGYRLPAGDTGFTFRPCPRPPGARRARGTDFYLGFYLEPGHAAPAAVWPSGASRPLWVTFACPAAGASCGP
jgi:hypothetical protein